MRAAERAGGTRVQRSTVPTERDGSARISRDLPLTPSAAAEARSEPMVAEELAALGIPVTVSREVTGVTEVPEPREATPAETPGTGGQASGRPTEPATVPGTVSAAPDSSTPEQVEALAEKLFRPLVRMIKAEILLDRERRGIRTDMW